jgi:hypothetical protein
VVASAELFRQTTSVRVPIGEVDLPSLLEMLAWESETTSASIAA